MVWFLWYTKLTDSWIEHQCSSGSVNHSMQNDDIHNDNVVDTVAALVLNQEGCILSELSY